MCCVINKHDVNGSNADALAAWCRDNGVEVVGRIPFDESVTRAMVAGRTVVEFGQNPARDAIEGIWREVERCLANGK